MNAKEQRLRENHERAILTALKRHNGWLSMFWITETRRRAQAVQRMQDSGRIKPGAGDFPFRYYTVARKGKA